MTGEFRKHISWKFFAFVLVVSAFLIFSWTFNNNNSTNLSSGMTGMAIWASCNDVDNSWGNKDSTTNPFGVNTLSRVTYTPYLGTEIVLIDNCLGEKINESYCSHLKDGDRPDSSVRTCPTGRICAENSYNIGRCITKCVDSDNSPTSIGSSGWDGSARTASYVNGLKSGDTSSHFYTDSCSGSTQVLEYYCDFNTHYVKSKYVSCGTGYSCVTLSGGTAGYCKQNPAPSTPTTTTSPTTTAICNLNGNPKCYDSDAGLFQNYEAGSVCYKNILGNVLSAEDKCGGIGQPANQLTEQTCSLLLGRVEKKVICENGCVDKKCVLGAVVSAMVPANLTIVNKTDDAISFKCSVTDPTLNPNPYSIDKVLFRTNLGGSWAITQQKNWLGGTGFGSLFVRMFTFNYNFTQNPVDDGIYYWKCEALDTGTNTFLPGDDKHYTSSTQSINVDFGGTTPTENNPSEQIDSLVYTETNQPIDVNLNDYFYDADGDELTYTVGSSPTGITIEILSDSELTLTPQLSFTGQRNLSISVFDGQETIEGKLEIYVGISAEENSAPVIDSYLPNSASVTLNSSQSKTFSVNASDADDDSLTYSWKQGSLNLSSTTSSLTFVSSALGPTVISVEVSDGIDTVSNSWNVQIAGSDDDSTCSNGVKELGEVCDENDLGSESCTTQGFDTGTLSCSSDCFSFDTSLCRVNPNEPSCGDGTCDSDETATGCPDDCSDQPPVEPPSTGYLIWIIVGVLVILSAVGALLVWKIQKDKTPSSKTTPPNRPQGNPGTINTGFRPFSPPPNPPRV